MANIIVHEYEERNIIEFEDFHSDECLEIEVPAACYQEAVAASFRLVEEFSSLRYIPCRNAIESLETQFTFGGVQ